MVAITADLVKSLRDKTGAGMMDCKTALEEFGGEMEAAVDWLRAKGLSKAAKKADRVAAEGLIGVTAAAKAAAVVEVNSETDFVARNAEFQKVVAEIAKLALKADGDVAKLAAMEYPKKKATVSDHLKELVATIGENMSLRRTAALKVKDGVVPPTFTIRRRPAWARSAFSLRRVDGRPREAERNRPPGGDACRRDESARLEG